MFDKFYGPEFTGEIINYLKTRYERAIRRDELQSGKSNGKLPSSFSPRIVPLTFQMVGQRTAKYNPMPHWWNNIKFEGLVWEAVIG